MKSLFLGGGAGEGEKVKGVYCLLKAAPYTHHWGSEPCNHGGNTEHLLIKKKEKKTYKWE